VNAYGKFVLGENDEGRRADRIVRKALPHIPLSTIYRFFREGKVTIEQRPVKPGERMKAGAILEIPFLQSSIQGDASQVNNKKSHFTKEAMPLLFDSPKIIWENQQLAAFHKPRGMLTHDGEASLEAYALSLLQNSITPSVSFKPGPLHRLDRNTSGIIMFPKSRAGAEKFSESLRNHRIRKFYVAILQGNVKNDCYFEDAIERNTALRKSRITSEGKIARLHLIPIISEKRLTLALIELFTGITHQIRVQLSTKGYPLLGDIKYGAVKIPNRYGYFLHAHTLYFSEPFPFEGMPVSISDDLPSDFSHAIYAINSMPQIDWESLITCMIDDIMKQ